MDLYNAINKRISIRKYENTAISDDIIKKIRQKIKDVQPLYNDIRVRIELIDNQADAGLIGMGYLNGLVKIMAPYSIVAVSELKDGYKENIGFMQEQLVLELTDMGIGTCWLGTFNEERIRKLFSLSDNERVTNVISLGYPLQRSFQNNGFRNLVGSKRKAADQLAYHTVWGQMASKYLTENTAIKKALDYSILAPSGGNKQPVYVLFTDSSAAFFVKNKNNSVVVNPWAELDAGIFISHFYLCCKEQKMNVTFSNNPDISACGVPSEFSYVISANYR